jgi:hypothetical protein
VILFYPAVTKTLNFSLAFLFITCNDKDVNEQINPFVGTWETNVNTSGQLPKKIGFTDQEVICYDEGEHIFSTVGIMPYPMTNTTISWQGAYDYVDTKLTIYHAPPSAINLAYELKNNILYLVGCPYYKK